MKSHRIIKQQIKNLLKEGEQAEPSAQPAPKKGSIKKGKVGRGRVKDKVKEAKALASKNPKKLMKNLNVSGASGASTEEKVLNLVRNAIYGTAIMSTAYSGARMEIDPETKEKYIKITPGDLGSRDGVLYMLHTITGADNAGLLGSIDADIEVGLKNGMPTITFTR